jgi:hypothetical protein
MLAVLISSELTKACAAFRDSLLRSCPSMVPAYPWFLPIHGSCLSLVQAKNTKEAWTCENLVRKYGDVRFKVGEDDDGHQVKMRPVISLPSIV